MTGVVRVRVMVFNATFNNISVNCSNNNSGCRGGDPYLATKWLRDASIEL
jgi:hypothetical protein